MRRYKDTVSKKAKQGAAHAIFSRMILFTIMVLAQLAVLALFFTLLHNYIIYYYSTTVLLEVILTIHIMNRDVNPSFKISWIIFVLLVPIFGAGFYLFFQNQKGVRSIREQVEDAERQIKPYLPQKADIMEELKTVNKGTGNLAEFLSDKGGWPVYKNTKAVYYPSGEECFQEMLKQLEEAKNFIFVEYFIVEPGIMWDSILAILKKKVKEGLDVRLLYDGTNLFERLPSDYPQQMKEFGIDCRVFLPVTPLLSTRQNNRDHRKILSIDGHTVFTGGINLADEYINRKERFGYWKDNGIMLKGDAAASFTMMFFQLWNVVSDEPENYKRYLVPEGYSQTEEKGYMIPYGDCPLQGENIGECIYMDLLARAESYVHIFTPYLVLDHEMLQALKFAAKRGVDVKIILPGIPDKKYVYLLARNHYEELIRAGVKIYEYRPGFVHAKVFSVDGICCTVGTVNLDFRSLYLHYECGVYIYDNPVVQSVEEDFEKTLVSCRQITEDNCRRYSVIKRVRGKVLRLIAPLM